MSTSFRSALSENHEAVPVSGTLCFVGGDWPLIARSFAIRGVDVIWPEKLASRLAESGELQAAEVQEIRQLLAGRFGAA